MTDEQILFEIALHRILGWALLITGILIIAGFVAEYFIWKK